MAIKKTEHETNPSVHQSSGPFPTAEQPQQPTPAQTPPMTEEERKHQEEKQKEEKEHQEEEKACLKKAAEESPFRYGVESLPGAGAPHPEDQQGFQSGGFAAEEPKRGETGGTRNPI